jgi:predicted nuclease of predicted toxin-antitoxin system
MKILADVNIEKPIVDYTVGIGFDVKWIPDYNCMLPDDNLLTMANTESRVLMTNDKDFGELVFRQNKITTGIILVRMKGASSEKKVKAIKKLFKNYPSKIYNHFVVVAENKMRFVPLKDFT